MISAYWICLLAVGVTAVSSQFVSGDFEDVPVSERRTFKHGKPVKFLPLVKKHKKFGLIPHSFAKPAYSEGPVVHESPRPLYKFHRYQGIEVKPISDFASTPEPFVETHSVEPPTFQDYAPAFPGDSFPHDFTFSKPISSPKPSFNFVPPPQPVFQSIPISIPAPVAIPRPVIVSIPSVPAPSPVFQTIPVKIQAPSPAPFPTVNVPPPVFTPIASLPPPAISIPAPSPAPIASFPVLPSPAPSFHALPSPAPSFHALPSPAPSFAALPSPLPSFHALPSPAPTFSFSAPEPEYPYPPSGTPLPSYIKDISLGDIPVKDTTIEPPKFDEAPSIINDESKHLDQGLLQKFKGWKADKANAALSYFKPKPISFPQPTKLPLELLPSQAPILPSVQFASPVQPLPLAPNPVFFRPQFLPPVKYESFPPNHIEPPTLFNSYGAPIPHDSYASDHASHERVSSASEEQPVVLPSPNEQNQDAIQQAPVRQEQYQQPIYVPEDNKTVKEETKTSEEVHQDVDNYQANAEDVAANLRNHKI